MSLANTVRNDLSGPKRQLPAFATAGRVQSQLSLTFANITEKQAVEILDCYVKVNGTQPWKYIRFNRGDDQLDPELDRGGAWEGVQEQA